jgi:hypothetical protein
VLPFNKCHDVISFLISLTFVCCSGKLNFRTSEKKRGLAGQNGGKKITNMTN